MKPSALHPGDRIGVIAPAGPPLSFHDVEGGIRRLEQLGFQVERVREFGTYGHMSGTDEERLYELNYFLRRPDVKAIFSLRGGFGALRLLPLIDYEAAGDYPKLLVGYSDVTALHLALYSRTGLTSVAGPMVGVEWPSPDPATERQFLDLVQGGIPSPLLGPNGEPLNPLRTGQAEGVLLGGNLTLVVKLIGSEFLPSLDGAILFIEEVGEEPYRVDGLFAQLKLSGILERLGGLVIGSFTDCESRPDRPSLTVDEVINSYTAELPCPVANGLLFGHFPVKASIPIGVRARLEVNTRAARLDVLESVVR